MRNRTILNGDAGQKLIEIEDNSIDEIVTDPSYGYSFMNKDWDKVVIGSSVWKECLRVLKPGSFAFVMSAPRQDVLRRVIANLDKAGFTMGFTSIYWAYASGFPKAMNVSKAVDKKLGVESKTVEYEHPGRKNRSYNVNVGFSDVSERSTEGKQQKSIATSKEAIKLDGSYAGFQPKPALEVILVCMKPLSEKNYVEQALSNGHGVTWLDDCRIPYKNERDIETATRWSEKGMNGLKHYRELSQAQGYDKLRKIPHKAGPPNNQGRFPANLLVSDNALDVGKKVKSSGGKSGTKSLSNQGYGLKPIEDGSGQGGYQDEGDFSRYYSLDSWEAQFIITPKPSKSEKNDGLDRFVGKQVNDGRNIPPDNAFQRGKTVRQNIHPTVKPVELFKYLISMGSRPNDIILDPFMGSGTTAIACEKLARNWVGIEINYEYCKIIEARIDDYRKQMRLF